MTQAESILSALGGWDNITTIEACITRIRVDVKDTDCVDESALEKAGAFGVVGLGQSLQVVMGPEAEEITAEIEALR
ncbi:MULTISPECIES: glucose PTS transporter subunit EIIB [unclassified Schaalia]|uniref:glucose PTS transporter subunit EIIB n=1 Tax=unclassified Schaalia TaxID=2691889 RepID=UPI001E309393|nr:MULTISPECIES: PTS glucose/sucrose transporter subunit IIB [unclassified Schaalia]MCD4549526.1 PTS glucose/sucrose transporter subunit IIB [Schaalia sp. lx-260]MCD4558203.1 PTS glucose/sucrose transporter subunit IIB [Schaalia sp. lx-100]